MSTLFFITGLLLVMMTAPLMIELLLLTAGSLLPKRKARNASEGMSRRLAVVVPAHNEEDSISRCVLSLRKSATPSTTIFVIAHNCSDSTAAVAEAAGAEVLIYNDSTATGKAHALRFGFAHAIQQNAEGVLIVDADSTVSANLIPSVLRAFANGADAVQCRYEMQSMPGQFKSELVSLAVRGFNFVRPLGRQRLGLSTGILGNGFALSVQTLQAVPYDALSIVEDLEYHLHLVCAGKRVLFLDGAVVSSKLPVSQTGEAAQHSRWQGGRLRVASVWIPRLLRELFRGRLAVIEPLLDLSGMPMAFAVTALGLAACIPSVFVRSYVAASLLIVSAHVLAAIFAGPRRLRTLSLLVLVPFYLLWKIRLVPSVLRASSARATWVRTDRKITARSAS